MTFYEKLDINFLLISLVETIGIGAENKCKEFENSVQSSRTQARGKYE